MESMNSIIKQISSEYKDDEFEINKIFLDTVMEAEDVTSVDDDSNKMKFGEKLGKQVQELIKTLEGIIQRVFLKITNFLGRVAQTNDGFVEDCRKAIVDNKPLEGVKLITYQYNDGLLEGEMNKMTQAILKRLSEMKTSYAKISESGEANLMEKNSDEIISTLLQEIGVPSDVKNLDTYFMYVKDKFRVSKKETLFTASQTQKYYQTATDVKKILAIANNKQQILKQQTNTIKSNLQNITKNTASQNEIKQRALRQYKNVTHLYNFYVHFVDIYVQLKVEESFSYRAILKKLYHF